MSFGNKMRLLVAGSACLLLVLALAVSYRRTDHEKEMMDTLSFECALGGQKTAFRPWKDEEAGIYYLVLPSCFRTCKKEFTLRFRDGGGSFTINGIPSRDGDVFCPEEGESYRIRLAGYFGAEYMDKTLQVLVSERLPALLFSVEAAGDVLDAQEFADKRYLETGSLLMLDETGELLCAERLERFKTRGNLTATLDKKPLTFTFENPLEVCGMAPARKWNLLANATDGSYIRNKIVLDLANESVDGYEPDGEFAEVYLNGVYQGLYLLTEAVEAAENRLELPAESWFLEMELDFRREEGGVYVTTDKGQIFEIKSLTESGADEKEQERVLAVLNDIESALYDKDGVSAVSGRPLGELIDLDSWAEAFLIQEISGDHDTGIASQFSYMPEKEASLLYAGPVWDYDGTMGNVNTAMYQNPRALTASICQTRPEGNANQNRWFSAMYRNPRFRRTVEEKYEKIFRDNLGEMIEVRIDGYVRRIRKSAMLDALRWHDQRLSWMFVIPAGLEVKEEGSYERFDTLDLHVAFVKDFLSGKKEFLDGLWVEKRDYCVVEVRNPALFLNQDYNQTLYYWVERGTGIEGLPHYEDEKYRFAGYRDLESGRMVSEGSVIDEDCILEGSWEEKD